MISSILFRKISESNGGLENCQVVRIIVVYYKNNTIKYYTQIKSFWRWGSQYVS